MSSYEPVTKDTFPSQIARQIKAMIVDGQLAANQRLPTEQDLAARFNVSRPTVREALKRLAAQNLIRSQRGPTGGTFVNGPSIDEEMDRLAAVSTMLVSINRITIDEIADARQQLEMLCVRLSALRRSDEQLSRMEHEIAFQKRIEATDAEFCASDVRFHRTLVDASGNSLLRFLMAAVVEGLQPISNLIVFRYRDRREIVHHHQRIVDHLRDRDGPGAAMVIEEQIAYLREHYAKAQAAREDRGDETTVEFRRHENGASKTSSS
ncbi:FadR/GntR family transcriptional regulator [Pararhizobium mangrovi]|uniref:FadR family transcriptional regulator n=1 Tax=Pararhizobium mangrovi TaxID=2590452 RepID=A0A506TUV4_9HYPH|nr:FadR/GntR family transcriptional regulator [Pararhizobium mangrovi]TPW25842.1 FadR family transcriptional regulator [Pararhizobium mangrovi]